MYEQDLDGLSGEFRDPVNYNGAVAAAVIGGFFLAPVVDLAIHTQTPIGALFFMLLFPLACAVAILIALTTATITYDRSGWAFTRNLLGHVREQEQGKWADVTGTLYQQWYVSGGRSGGGTLYGELQLLGSTGAIVLRARTAFFMRGNPTARHSAGKRMIGLPPDGFDAFVRLIDRETTQLDYVWTRVDVDPDAKIGGFLARPGPAHYVRTPRGGRAEPGIDDSPAADSDPLPTWRGRY